MISGQKVIIKAIDKSDSQDILKWVNQEELRRLTGTLYPVSEFEHEEWIKKTLSSSDKKLFLVLEKNSARKLGTIGLKNFNHTARNAELFISLKVSGGYGTDAIETLVDYCFKRLNLHKIYLYVFESNTRAIRCYQKAGFVQEGCLYEHHFDDYGYENVVVMGRINDKSSM